MDESSHAVEEAPRSSAPRRRGLLPRFGLRTLLVLALFVSPFSAYVARNLYREQERKEALAELEGWRAMISSDVEDFVSWMPSSDEPEPTNAWLKPGTMKSQAAVALGIGPARDVRTVSFYYSDESSAGDEALAGFEKFDELEALHLYGTGFTDQGLLRLGESENLRRLTLNATGVTPQGLAESPVAPRLTHLKLASVYREGGLFAAAGQMPELRQLIAHRACVTREEMAAFAPPKLEQLSLADVDFFDGADFAVLADLPNLRRADFDYVRLSDVEVAALAKSRSLEELRLIGTEVSDAGLMSLADVPALRMLTIDDVVTPEGVAAFQKRAPRCAIDYVPIVGTTRHYPPVGE